MDEDEDDKDVTHCCGCGKEIAPEQEQWVHDGAKYHKHCYYAAKLAWRTLRGQRQQST